MFFLLFFNFFFTLFRVSFLFRFSRKKSCFESVPGRRAIPPSLSLSDFSPLPNAVASSPRPFFHRVEEKVRAYRRRRRHKKRKKNGVIICDKQYDVRPDCFAIISVFWVTRRLYYYTVVTSKNMTRQFLHFRSVYFYSIW